jgi:hypothetical protein
MRVGKKVGRSHQNPHLLIYYKIRNRDSSGSVAFLDAAAVKDRHWSHKPQRWLKRRTVASAHSKRNTAQDMVEQNLQGKPTIGNAHGKHLTLNQ